METGTGFSMAGGIGSCNPYQLIHTQRKFLEIVSHDLKTPLFVMRILAQQLSNSLSFRSTGRNLFLLNHLETAVKRMESILNDLTDFTSIQAGKLKVNKVMAEIGPVLEGEASAFRLITDNKGVEFSAQIQPGLPLLNMDTQRIIQVLLNLLGNAVKHTPRGGKIELRAVSINHHISIEIEDTGDGIPPGEIDKVFNAHYQVKGSEVNLRTGMGMGLTICREIINEHQGTITIRSEGVNKGTLVSLDLPAVVSAPLFSPPELARNSPRSS